MQLDSQNVNLEYFSFIIVKRDYSDVSIIPSGYVCCNDDTDTGFNSNTECKCYKCLNGNKKQGILSD